MQKDGDLLETFEGFILPKQEGKVLITSERKLIPLRREWFC